MEPRDRRDAAAPDDDDSPSSGGRKPRPQAPREDEPEDDDAPMNDAGAETRPDAVAADDPADPPAGDVPDAGLPTAGAAGGAGGGGGGAVAGDAGTANAPTPDEDSIVGVWGGEFRGAVLGRTFRGCLEVTQIEMPGPAGVARYAGDTNCTTRLEFLDMADGAYRFSETSTQGVACPQGTTVLSLTADDALDYKWYLGNATAPETTGTLSRVESCP